MDAPFVLAGAGCDVNGMRVANSSSPCRALLASAPGIKPGINEQLLNNLGLEFGIIFIGSDAEHEIHRRAEQNQSFLFYDEYPSYVTSSSFFRRVQLPHHNAKQWKGNVSTVSDVGPIDTDFMSTPPVKLGNANTLGLHPQVEQFLKQFELSEFQSETLLTTLKAVLDDAASQMNCVGEGVGDCAVLYDTAACNWLHANNHSWPEFLPRHAHCGVGQKVRIETNLSSSCTLCEQGTYMNVSTFETTCHLCPAGRFNSLLGQSACEECPAGTQGSSVGMVDEADACLDCNQGWYQDEEGQTDCKICDRGTYQVAEGATFCAVCTTGQYQDKPNSTNCESCPAAAMSCSIELDVGVEGVHIQEMCLSGQSDSESCTCSPNHFRSAGGHCKICPEGAYCCLCAETVACYDSDFGECNETLLQDYMGNYNSTCPKYCGGTAAEPQLCSTDQRGIKSMNPGQECWSGSKKPIAMPGYFESQLVDLDGDPLFAACNLRLPTPFRRTSLDYIHQGCRGGPNSTCSEGSSGDLCRTCDDGSYLSNTGKCSKCSDSAGARVLQIGLLVFFIFILIPLLFLIFYFSVSDKSSNQMMVYPRIFIDLATGLYLIYSSLFRYFDFEALDKIYHATDGKSRVEMFNSLFMSCAFPDLRNSFVTRYFTYLFLPMILYFSVLLQIGFVYLLYRNNGIEEDTTPTADDESDDGYDGGKKKGCCGKIAASMPDVNTPRGSRFGWATPDSERSWNVFKDHATQVWTVWNVMIYITVVNYSFTVFDCSSGNSHVYDNMGNGTAVSFMEEQATIKCSFNDPDWKYLAVGFVIATLCYTIFLPTRLAYIFWKNKKKARRGEIGYLRRYGFLLKPYRQKAYYWEIVNIVRKTGLSVIVKFFNASPFVCGALATVMLFCIVANQANMRPYKYAKHNDCAVFVLSVSLLNFLSSMFFVSELPTETHKMYLGIINLVAIGIAVCWTLGGAARDMYNFARSIWYDAQCEAIGFAEEERQIMWETVDSPGVLNLVWYDFLVKRNRYRHTSQREVIVGLQSETATTDGDDFMVRQLFDRKYVTRLVKEDQVEARATFEKFHEGLAAFISRMDEDRITPDYEREIVSSQKKLRDQTNAIDSLRARLGGLKTTALLEEARGSAYTGVIPEAFLKDVTNPSKITTNDDLIKLMVKTAETAQVSCGSLPQSLRKIPTAAVS